MKEYNQHPLIQKDPLLKPFAKVLQKRWQRARLRELDFTDGKAPLSNYANNHLYYGLHKTDTHWTFREKCPNAVEVFLYGDFSYWQIQKQFALHRIENGDWEIEIPLSFLKHGELFRLWVVWQNGADDRLPAYSQRVVQDDVTKVFSAQVWDPQKEYVWQFKSPPRPHYPIIYEAHIGMSSEEEKISSCWEFKEKILPKIKSLGYNAIQLMAVQEHPYYGSFGYQVSNFFTPSFRFGTPEEYMELIDTAHKMGIYVILDLVHSHAVSNEKEGIGNMDGSKNLYFFTDERGYHPVWDSRCFNYGKTETILFLLSNVKYWMEKFHFDGFRFDGITSMIYRNHGIGVDFVNYKQYFDENVDEDAIVYLTLANQLIKELNPDALSIAEDVSGLPGLAFPISLGGVGFDYRMSMGVADFWHKSIKEVKDENWSVGDLFYRLTDKRTEESVISYVECHDQAMVGDKTLIFQMLDKEIYNAMSVLQKNLTVDRGVALHKIIRLLTLSLSQGGYLNFMGNEFGHPEWIDFPRDGNGWSYKYARRQWHLSEDNTLNYYYLNRFDAAMISCIEKNKVLEGKPSPIVQNNEDQVLAYLRNETLFVVNLSPNISYTDYEIYAPKGDYHIILNTDSQEFAGFGRVDESQSYATYMRSGGSFLKLYLPTRTLLVLHV